MCLASVDDLYRSDCLSNVTKTLGVMKQHRATLIGAGTAGETNGKYVGIELRAVVTLYRGKQLLFRRGMRHANIFKRNADCVAEIIVVQAPGQECDGRIVP